MLCFPKWTSEAEKLYQKLYQKTHSHWSPKDLEITIHTDTQFEFDPQSMMATWKSPWAETVNDGQILSRVQRKGLLAQRILSLAAAASTFTSIPGAGHKLVEIVPSTEQKFTFST